jgi:rRNA maturation endonuclease Nob1
MSLIESLKRTVGMESDEPDNEWTCQGCDNVFRTRSEEGHFVTCRECGSGDVERTGEE